MLYSGEMTSMKQNALPLHTARILSDTQPHLLALGGGSHYPLYHLLRVTAAQIAPVDSFYIGFFCDDNTAMLFPYTYDGEVCDDPDKYNFALDGITATLLKTQQPYWFQNDKGVLLKKGRRFGDTERLSEDAIVVPLLMMEVGSGKRIIGLMGMLTYTHNAYTQDTVRAFEWLADLLVTVLQRERDDKEKQHELGMTKDSETGAAVTVLQIVENTIGTIGSIRRHAQAIRAGLPPGNDAAVSALEELCWECEKGQTDTINLLLRSTLGRSNPLSRLTRQQREVAILIAGGQSKEEIAARLFISPNTVKTHTANIFAKLEVSSRHALTQLLKPFLPASAI